MSCYDCIHRNRCGNRAYYEADPRQVCRQYQPDPESFWNRGWT